MLVSPLDNRGSDGNGMERPLDAILNFFRRLGWPATLGLSLLLLAGSLVLVAMVALRWPVDQFKNDVPPPFWATSHPVVRVLGLIGKNLAGVLVVMLGIIMAVPGVPGQGTLLILTGLTLIDFPGKRRLERRLIRRPSVLKLINGLRHRFRRAPLEVE
jgi:hypothetical protein